MAFKTVMVTSFKGGVGKSTVAANLALFFALSGKKTLLVDCDFRMRSLDILLGVENNIVHDASDIMADRVPLEKAVLTDSRTENLLFLPAPFNYTEGINPDRFLALLKEADEKYSPDIAVLDTPGSSGEEFSAAAACSDVAYIVANHAFPALRAAECTGATLGEMGVSERILLINMFDMSGKDSEKRPSVVDIIDNTGLRLGGIIPYDRRFSMLQDEGKLADEIKDSNIAKAFENTVGRAEGKNIPLFTGFKRINKKKLLGY